MKVEMYNWANSARNLPVWFQHKGEADITTDQIIELFNTGNNIMLAHAKPESGIEAILFVDDRRFTQR